MRHFSAHDPEAEAYATVLLADSGFATQGEVAHAFGRSVRTVRRHQRRYVERGIARRATRSGLRALHAGPKPARKPAHVVAQNSEDPHSRGVGQEVSIRLGAQVTHAATATRPQMLYLKSDPVARKNSGRTYSSPLVEIARIPGERFRT